MKYLAAVAAVALGVAACSGSAAHDSLPIAPRTPTTLATIGSARSLPVDIRPIAVALEHAHYRLTGYEADLRGFHGIAPSLRYVVRVEYTRNRPDDRVTFFKAHASHGVAVARAEAIRWAESQGFGAPVIAPHGWYMSQPSHKDGDGTHQFDLVGWSVGNDILVYALRVHLRNPPPSSAAQFLTMLHPATAAT